jgi:hypothetical protein
VALVIVLGVGFWRGRKRGMSREFLPVCMWLVLVAAAGFGNHLIGNFLLDQGVVQQTFGRSVDAHTAAYLTGYLIIALLVALLFLIPKKYLKKKLEGSNAFGAGEYYLGICAGMIRWFCMLLAVLACLHAPTYSAADIQAEKAYKNRWYGGGMKDYSGDFIPPLYEVQDIVFKDSLTGPYIQSCLGGVLIQTALAPEQKTPTMEIK